jgi:hypothetical protein
MEFFLGLLTAVAFFIVYELGRHEGGKAKAKQTPVDKEQQKQMEQYNKGFQAVFTYDVAKALQKKKVE